VVGVVERLPVVLIATHKHEQVRAEADQVLLRPEVIVLQSDGPRGGTFAGQDPRALDRRVVGHDRQLRAGDQCDMVLKFMRRQARRASRFLRQDDRGHRLLVTHQGEWCCRGDRLRRCGERRFGVLAKTPCMDQK
jgi:hypothetical protein